MLRILQVVTHMNRGGLETLIMNYYRNIDRDKVQFDFLTHREYEGDYGEEIKALGGKIYHLPILNPFGSVYKKALGSFFEKHPEYKTIHVHQDCLSSVILKVAKQYGVAVRIAHSHSANQDKNLKYPIKLFYKNQIKKYATHMLACGEKAGKWMFGCNDFTVLNNAIDAKKYKYNPEIRKKLRDELGIGNSEIAVGHIGRFSPAKNHTFLIDVFEKIAKARQAKLIMVGKGELQEQIKEKSELLGLSDKVIFTGLRDDIPDLLQAMDVFVFPSNYEGMPVSMIEAQSSGLPCLISDRVPKDCIITDLVKQISLKTEPKFWADEAIKAAETQRRDTFDEIKAAGFDIKENAFKLQDFYIKVFGGGE